MRYAALTAESPEVFVRRALAAVEADTRALALRALVDWSKLGIGSAKLFEPIAALQRPSFGSWNGLLTALRVARKEALRDATPSRREAIAGARALEGVLERLNYPISKEVLIALATFLRRNVESKARWSDALVLCIALRNRVAHDSPIDPRWWSDAAAALRPLIDAIDAIDFFGVGNDARAEPWFVEEGGVIWTFASIGHDFSVTYVASNGEQREDAGRAAPVLDEISRLLGKKDIVERDLRSLLGRFAPEDVRGIVLGDNLVGRPIGEGGFATVHVGRQLSTGRRVAVKILRDGTPELVRARFRQEAEFLAHLSNPGIVGVYEYGEDAWSAPRHFSPDDGCFLDFRKGASVKA